MAIAITATWTARPGMEDVVRDSLANLASAAREEPGCQVYFVHQAAEEPTVFRIFEIYDDEAAIEAHTQSPGIQKYAMGAVEDAISGRTAEFTTILDL